MISILGQYVNKPVLVSIPSLFEDGEPHACTLVGIESAGLWLESEELTRKVCADGEDIKVQKVFVPFPQITFLLQSVTASTASSNLDKATPKPATDRTRNAPAAQGPKKRR